MLDGGVTANHSNAIEFGDLDELDAPTLYTLGFKFRPRVASMSSSHVLGKNNSAQTTGWGIRIGSGNTLRVRHQSTNYAPAHTAFVEDDYSVVVTFSAAANEIYWDIAGGITESGTVSSVTVDPAGNAAAMVLLNVDGLGDGIEAALGHVMVWAGKILTAGEIQQYHDGVIVPASGDLSFWHKGIAVPGVDELGGSTPTEQGTVNLLANDVDTMFSERTLELHAEVAGRLLRRRRFPEERYSTVVVPRFLNVELGDEVNLAHDSLILPSSVTDDIDAGGDVAKQEYRSYGRAYALELEPATGRLGVGYRANDFYACSFWSTDRVNSIGDNLVGLAQVDPGATKTFTRGTVRYLPGPDSSYAHIGSAVEAINEVGYLAEDSVSNDVDNSCNRTALSGWTIVESTSNNVANAISQPNPFRRGDVSGQHFTIAGEGAGDNYIEQDISTTATDGHRQVHVLYSGATGGFAPGGCQVAVQRSDDSRWWNDSTPGWQVSKVWNTLDAPTLTANPTWTDDGLEPITVDWTGTMKIQVGQSAAIGAGLLFVGNVQCTKGRYRYEHIPTDVNGDRSIPSGFQSQPSVADERKWVLDLGGGDPFRQVYVPDRGELRFKLIGRQEASWINDGDQFILFYIQVGSNTDNREVVMYEKQSGENARLSVRRYTGGTQRARAYKEFDMARGTTYECRWRWVSADGEFGLPARTSSIFVDGSKGVDAASSAIPSNSELHTELWVGMQPASLGGLRAMNMISDWEIMPRVHADEQSLSYR